MTRRVVIAGGGIVGVSAGIWLKRFTDAEVTLIDRAGPGEGTSYGNGGVLAACAMVPVTIPGLVPKAPKMLFDPDYPLFLRWSYLPKLMPWLLRYLSNANDRDTRRIATGLTPIVSDTIEQHQALVRETAAEHWVIESPYSFAYRNRAAFEGDAYIWGLRKIAGFEPELREGAAVRDFEPSLAPDMECLATLHDHGHIRDPGGYVKALAQVFEKMGGNVRKAEIRDFEIEGGAVSAVLTDQGPVPCDAVVLATGVWSKPLMGKLGLKVPLETERGYHIVFEGATGGPHHPMMITTGKFVATPMEAGLRCAGIVEFGGLEAGPSKAPFELLRRQAKATFPNLEFASETEWHGHRPAPADSLPLIGEVGTTRIYAAFGHHHIGLTGGPKTGRIVAGLIAGQPTNLDLAPYSPQRFGQGVQQQQETS
jgi:D-amino-acid dehydrogenase